MAGSCFAAPGPDLELRGSLVAQVIRITVRGGRGRRRGRRRGVARGCRAWGRRLYGGRLRRRECARRANGGRRRAILRSVGIRDHHAARAASGDLLVRRCEVLSAADQRRGQCRNGQPTSVLEQAIPTRDQHSMPPRSQAPESYPTFETITFTLAGESHPPPADLATRGTTVEAASPRALRGFTVFDRQRGGGSANLSGSRGREVRSGAGKSAQIPQAGGKPQRRGHDFVDIRKIVGATRLMCTAF